MRNSEHPGMDLKIKIYEKKDLGHRLLEFASTTNLDWGPRFANICPIRDPALPIFAQLAIKNLSKVQTRTIGRGALKFATQISPLLNLYYLIKVKKVFAKYYNGFDSSMQIITFIKQKTRTFLQICFLKICFLKNCLLFKTELPFISIP